MIDDPVELGAILRSEIEVLEAYLLKGDVFRQVPISCLGNRAHLMSIADYLEHRDIWLCLERQGLVSEEGRHASPLLAEGNRLLKIFSSETDTLARRELASRVRSLTWAMDEWSREGEPAQAHFSTAMGHRARVQRLADFRGWFGHQAEVVDLDRRIESHSLQGPFCGPIRVRSAFPEADYWFLYRRVRTQ
jgi:hypothetical protein